MLSGAPQNVRNDFRARTTKRRVKVSRASLRHTALAVRWTVSAGSQTVALCNIRVGARCEIDQAAGPGRGKRTWIDRLEVIEERDFCSSIGEIRR